MAQLTIQFNNEAQDMLVVNVEDNSTMYQSLSGENNVQLNFNLSEYTEIPLGSTIEVFGQVFTLFVPATITKKNTKYFEIQSTFEGQQYALRKYTMKDCAFNDTAQTWDDTRYATMQFSLTATASEHLKLICDNMNMREGDNEWTFSIDNMNNAKDHKTLTFDYTKVRDALTNLCQEYNAEWQVVGKCIHFGKIMIDNQELSLEYGQGNGFKSGVGRVNYGDAMPCEVLNVQGTDRNIDPSRYKPTGKSHQRLILPRLIEWQYDDNGAFSFNFNEWRKWNDDTEQWDILSNYEPLNPQQYKTDMYGLSIYLPQEQRKTGQEECFDGTEIYPKRTGIVSNVVTTAQSEQTLYDIVDLSIPNSLDYSEYQIAGEEMKVVFQSGMLAGKEFAIAKYTHGTRTFELCNAEIDGMIMPEPTAYKPQIGDKYIVFGCTMPDSYICDYETRTGASFDLLRSATEFMHKNKNARYTFKGDLDGIWAKQNWATVGGCLRIGQYVNFKDSNFQSQAVKIRITGLKQSLNNPYSPTIELSNDSVGTTIVSRLRQAEAQEVTTAELHKEALSFTKRRFNDAKETSKAIQDAVDALGDGFSESINPATVNTLQLLVGSENLQFEFGTISNNTFNIAEPTFGWDKPTKTFSITNARGYIKHFTIGYGTTPTSGANPNKTCAVWKIPPTFTTGALTSTDLQEKPFYVYAQCTKSAMGTETSAPTAIQQFVMSETALTFDTADKYNLLVGILSSEINGDRSFAPMYGYTEILPGRLTTGKIVSKNGNTYFDLDNGTISGDIRFVSNGQQKTVEQGIAEATTIGGRNLVLGTDAIFRGQKDTSLNYQLQFSEALRGLPIKDLVTKLRDVGLALQFDINARNITNTSGATGYIGVRIQLGLNNITTGNAEYYTLHVSNPTATNTTGQGSSYISVSNSNTLTFNGHYAGFGKFTDQQVATVLNNPSNYTFRVLYCMPTFNNITYDSIPNIQNVKVELGTQCTDYSLAPEDTQTNTNLLPTTPKEWKRGAWSDQGTFYNSTSLISVDKDFPMSKGSAGRINTLTISQHGTEAVQVCLRGFTSGSTQPMGGPNFNRWDSLPLTATIPNDTAFIRVTVRKTPPQGGTAPDIDTDFVRQALIKMEEGRRVTPWTPSTSDQQLSLNVVNALDATFAEARQATTNIQGGLVLTNTIIAGEGTDQSGMTGAQSNDVAFWAGGTLEQAQANTAPVVINRNGNAKFGLLELLGKGASAIMSMFSSDGKERLRLQTNNLTSSSVASQAYYNPSNSQNTNTYDYFDNSPNTTFTTNFTTQQLNEGQETYMLALDKQIIATPPAAHIGTKCYVDRYGASGNNYSYIDITPIQVGSSQPILHYAEAGVTVGETFIKVGTLPQTGQTTTQRILFDDLWNFNITSAVRFQIRYRGYCNVEIEFGYNGNKGGFGYYYYNDVTQARTIIAKNGLGVIVNNLNHLLATYNNSKFLFKYRGDLDVSGCIAVFEQNTDSTKDVIFKASSITIVTKKIENGRGEFTITGVSSKLIVNITPMGGTGARVSSVTLNGTSCIVVFHTYNGTSLSNNPVHISVFGKLV